MAGVTVPIIPFAHQYLVTEPIEGVTPDLPQLRDPDHLVYFRPEVRGPGDGRLRAQSGRLVDSTASAPDFNGKLLAARLAALRGDQPRRRPPRAGHGQRRGHDS